MIAGKRSFARSVARAAVSFCIVLSVYIWCAPVSAQTCQVPVDVQTLRTGKTVLPYAGTEPGFEGTGVEMAFLGQASANSRQYSIWKLVNTTDDERRVSIFAEGTQEANGTFQLPAHSETVLRSTALSPPSTYWFYDSFDNEIQIPQPTTIPTWTDARLVDDPFCNEPDAAVWVSDSNGLLRLSTVDASVLLAVPSTPTNTAPAALAVDPSNGNVWAYKRNRIQAFDTAGNLLIDASVSEGEGAANAPRRLAVDSAAGDVWVGVGSNLLRLDFSGAVIAQTSLGGQVRDIEVDPTQNLAWVATSAGLNIMQADDSDPANPGIASLAQVSISGGARSLAANVPAGEVWVSTSSALSRYDATGQRTFNFPTSTYNSLAFLEADGLGGAWGTRNTILVHFDATGAVDAETDIFDDEIALDLGVNPETGTAWLLTGDGIIQYSTAGPEDPDYGLAPITNIESPQAGMVPWAEEPYHIAVFADRGLPVIQFLSPAEGASLTTPRPALTVSYGDQSSAADPQTLQFKANGSLFSVSCTPLTANSVSCVPLLDLPQGSITVTATISDLSGNQSLPAHLHITIDNQPPPAPVAERVTVTDPEAGNVTVSGYLQAVAANSAVRVTNVRTGVTVTTAADVNGAFTAQIAAQQGDVIRVQAADANGNVSDPTEQTAGNAALSLVVTKPVAAVTVEDRSIVVSGIVLGSTHATITVAGHVAGALNTGAGTQFHALVDLAAGLNDIVVIAQDPRGWQATKHIAVTRTGDALFNVIAIPAYGTAPLSVAFGIERYSDAYATSVTYDFDGDGTVDRTVAGPTRPETFIYTQPGAYFANIAVTSSAGQVLNFVVPVVVEPPEQATGRVRSVWDAYVAALASSDLPKALSYVSGDSLDRYTEVLSDLQSDLATIAASFSAAVTIESGGNYATLGITRVIDGVTTPFIVTLIRDEDGAWRIAEM